MMRVTSDGVAGDLRKAADYLDAMGWTTGVDGLPISAHARHPLCLEGAIMRAIGMTEGQRVAKQRLTGHDPLRHVPAYRAMTHYLGARSLWQWNAARDRRGYEVTAALRACAELVEREKGASEWWTTTSPASTVARGV